MILDVTFCHFCHVLLYTNKLLNTALTQVKGTYAAGITQLPTMHVNVPQMEDVQNGITMLIVFYILCSQILSLPSSLPIFPMLEANESL